MKKHDAKFVADRLRKLSDIFYPESSRSAKKIKEYADEIESKKG